MRHSQQRLVTAIATLLMLAGTSLQAASPSLGGIEPRGIQRGVESVLTFNGGRLADAKEILFYSPGLEVIKLEPAAGNVKATVKVAPDCRLGQHVAQVRTASGVSEYRTFYIGPFAPTPEKEPNSDFATPQPIPLNITVTGVVQNEDVDYYVVEAKKGQRISAEVEGMRLGTALFDPYVAILDSKRFELASADDSPLIWQDALASAIAPEDGKYIIEVRESAYAGSGSCRYRLHVGTFPRPTAVYPAGGKLGEQTKVTFLGDPSGDIVETIQLPSQLVENYGLEPKADGQVAPSPNPFRLFPHGNVLEVEPNDDMKQASPAELPLAFNGIIGKKGDVDYFKFSAKKGQSWEIECYARRIRSGLDPVMNLYKADGGSISGNDDSRGPDSYFRFNVPADGEYVLRITDHLGRGAKDFVYRVELTPPKVGLSVSIPRVSRYSQYRQWIVVPRGNRFASLMTVGRSNFGGDVVLDPQQLPPGITIHAEAMPANASTMPVVFEAAADAPIGGKLIDFTVRHADPKQDIKGGYRNTGDFIRGAPGQSVYWKVDVGQIPVCVVDEVPFRLEIIEPKVPIVRNGTMQLKIVAHKKEGWDEQINLQMPFRPPGISATSSINMPKGKNEVFYPISANGSAGIKKWKYYIIGSANAGGTAWVSSQLATLEISEPYLAFEMLRAATEQGKDTEIVCKINQAREFPDKAKVELLGLPAGATTSPLEITKETKELVFPIKTTKETRAGTHKNIFCRVLITQNSEPVMHSRVGATELRVDKPIPPKKNEPPKPKPVVVAKKPEPKKPEPVKKVRLTRLQQLRLDAKKKTEVEAGGGGGGE
ncbi:MAG: PPC domain-containing protein [Pirellulaceae bacterium]